MHVIISFALSLTLSAGWDGNNGFDPTTMFDLNEGSA